MTTTTLNPPRAPLGERVNVRLIVFLTVVAVPFLAIFYVFLSQLLGGGITQHADYAEVDLKALGNFQFNPDDATVADVPARWRGLDGKRVELKGFMYKPQSAGPIGVEFQFVYNVNKCCFTGPPLVQERVYGRVANGKPIQLYPPDRFVRLVGTLHVRVNRDEVGGVHSVFDMDVESADPA